MWVIVTPLLPSYDPYGQSLSDALKSPFENGFAHVFGTDALGRDTFSRVALATRVTVLIGAAVVAINMLVGVTLGLLAGFFGGALDRVVVFLADMQLSMPNILILAALVAALGRSVTMLVLVMGLTMWVRYCRVSRAAAILLRSREFILAATTYGATPLRVLRKHVLPNVIPQVMILAVVHLATVVMVESSLSFLGLGVQPPLESLGSMISAGQGYLQTNASLVFFPGLALVALIGGAHALSEQHTGWGQPMIRAKAMWKGGRV
jgi:peptide/nickel transport system permease protein